MCSAGRPVCGATLSAIATSAWVGFTLISAILAHFPYGSSPLIFESESAVPQRGQPRDYRCPLHVTCRVIRSNSVRSCGCHTMQPDRRARVPKRAGLV
jgi:hypothetical protein